MFLTFDLQWIGGGGWGRFGALCDIKSHSGVVMESGGKAEASWHGWLILKATVLGDAT